MCGAPGGCAAAGGMQEPQRSGAGLQGCRCISRPIVGHRAARSSTSNPAPSTQSSSAQLQLNEGAGNWDAFAVEL